MGFDPGDGCTAGVAIGVGIVEVADDVSSLFVESGEAWRTDSISLYCSSVISPLTNRIFRTSTGFSSAIVSPIDTHIGPPIGLPIHSGLRGRRVPGRIVPRNLERKVGPKGSSRNFNGY